MLRRELLETAAAAGLGLLGAVRAATPKRGPRGRKRMKAGFARAKITPPLGTTMMGFGGRDMAHGCDAIHDDMLCRTLNDRVCETLTIWAEGEVTDDSVVYLARYTVHDDPLFLDT